MKPDSTSYENILEVENWGSQLSTFYKIMSPVQITLESCTCLLYISPSPRDRQKSRMPSSA